MLLADRRFALLGGEPVLLTRLEYDLLLYLADSADRVLTRGSCCARSRGTRSPAAGRTVDVHVRRLRAKLGGRGPVLSTVRGIGYRMDSFNRVAVVRDAAPPQDRHHRRYGRPVCGSPIPRVAWAPAESIGELLHTELRCGWISFLTSQRAPNFATGWRELCGTWHRERARSGRLSGPPGCCAVEPGARPHT